MVTIASSRGRVCRLTRPARHNGPINARGSKRDPQSGRYAAENRLQCAEFHQTRHRDTASGQQHLQPLAIRTAGTQTRRCARCRLASPARSKQGRERPKSPVPPRTSLVRSATDAPPARRRMRLPAAGPARLRSAPPWCRAVAPDRPPGRRRHSARTMATAAAPPWFPASRWSAARAAARHRERRASRLPAARRRGARRAATAGPRRSAATPRL